MFRALAFLALAAALASPALAQAEWNRKLSDIRIVHPPGTPPGTWRAQVYVDILTGPNTPMPSSLGFDVTARVNGVPVGMDSFDVTPQMIPNQCQFDCPSTICNQLQMTALASGTATIESSFCYDPPGPTYACNCWLNGWWWWFGTDLVLLPTDTIQFEMTARAGALPDTDTSDDSLTAQVWQEAPGTLYCSGDGTATACPCGTVSAPSNGCPNSVNPAGATLYATGTGSVSMDSVVLEAEGMPSSSVLYFQGTTMTAGGSGSLFGDGLRCASGSLIRLRTKINVGGQSRFPEPGEPLLSTAGGVPTTGGTYTYQAWYRNAQDYCTASTFNLTNGVRIEWRP